MCIRDRWWSLAVCLQITYDYLGSRLQPSTIMRGAGVLGGKLSFSPFQDILFFPFFFFLALVASRIVVVNRTPGRKRELKRRERFSVPSPRPLALSCRAKACSLFLASGALQGSIRTFLACLCPGNLIMRDYSQRRLSNSQDWRGLASRRNKFGCGAKSSIQL